MTACFANEQHWRKTVTLHQKLQLRTKYAAGNVGHAARTRTLLIPTEIHSNIDKSFGTKTQVNYAMKADLAGGFLETLEPVVPRGLVLSQVDGIREVGGDVQQHRTTDQRLRKPIQLQDVKLKTRIRQREITWEEAVKVYGTTLMQ